MCTWWVNIISNSSPLTQIEETKPSRNISLQSDLTVEGELSATLRNKNRGTESKLLVTDPRENRLPASFKQEYTVRARNAQNWFGRNTFKRKPGLWSHQRITLGHYWMKTARYFKGLDALGTRAEARRVGWPEAMPVARNHAHYHTICGMDLTESQGGDIREGPTRSLAIYGTPRRIERDNGSPINCKERRVKVFGKQEGFQHHRMTRPFNQEQMAKRNVHANAGTRHNKWQVYKAKTVLRDETRHVVTLPKYGHGALNISRP